MRYFFITYSYISLTKNGFGNIWLSSEIFPSYSSIKDSIVSYNKGEFKHSELTVTNIFEFANEDDYKSFAK